MDPEDGVQTASIYVETPVAARHLVLQECRCDSTSGAGHPSRISLLYSCKNPCRLSRVADLQASKFPTSFFSLHVEIEQQAVLLIHMREIGLREIVNVCVLGLPPVPQADVD